MTESSLVWGGTVTGDAVDAPYDDDEFSDLLRELVTADRTIEGVVKTNLASFSGLLAITNPAGTTVRVASGVGFVDGKMYYNDANIDFAAGTSGQYYRVVLRKSFAGQTVRAAILGPSGSAPALTQTDGVTWEVALATIYNSGGVLSITDERVFVNRVYAGMFDAGAVNTADIANDAVDNTKVGNRVPQLIRRQGGDANDWSILGITTYTPTMVIIQVGVAELEFTGTTGTAIVTFPVAFSNVPIVIGTIGEVTAGTQPPSPVLTVLSGFTDANGVTFWAEFSDGSSHSGYKYRVNWMAIGPE